MSDTKNNSSGVIWVILIVVILLVAVFGIIFTSGGDGTGDVYKKYAGLYHSDTGIKDCITKTSCLTSTEIYLSDTGLCAVGGTIANSRCHWKQNSTNSISIKHDSDDSLSFSNAELVDNGIIVRGVLFTRVRR